MARRLKPRFKGRRSARFNEADGRGSMAAGLPVQGTDGVAMAIADGDGDGDGE